MKRRSCRRTEDQNKIHDKAVKMRKMTDEQLVHYVEDRVEKARSEGYNEGKESISNQVGGKVAEFIDQLVSEKIPGVGVVTINKITKLAKEKGYV